jgi:hypothetical protein
MSLAQASCAACQALRVVPHPVTWLHPHGQWWLDASVSRAGQSSMVGLLGKAGRHTHYSTAWAPEEPHGPQPLFSHFHFLQEINNAIFPNA